MTMPALLVLSLHLLAPDGARLELPRERLQLADARLQVDLAGLVEGSSPLPGLRKLDLAQAAVAEAEHELFKELGAGWGFALATHLVAAVLLIPVLAVVTLVLLVSAVGGGGNNALADAAIGALLGIIVLDVIGAPFAATYAIATRHGDTSAGPFALGYIGGLLGELLGYAPFLLVSRLPSNQGALTAGLSLLLFGLDALATSAGSAALYHLAAASPGATPERVAPPAPILPPDAPPPAEPSAPPPPVVGVLSFSF